MDWIRMGGYAAYGIGIIGGAEGALKPSLGISIGAVVVMLLGAALLAMKRPA